MGFVCDGWVVVRRRRVVEPTGTIPNLFKRVGSGTLALARTVDDAGIGMVPQNWLKYAMVRQ